MIHAALAVCFVVAALRLGPLAAAESELEPIPEKIVVLTFDDSVGSHFTVVRVTGSSPVPRTISPPTVYVDLQPLRLQMGLYFFTF